MNENNWIQVVTAIGAVATPILILILTGIGRGIGMRLERRLEREDKLRERQLVREDRLLDRQLELQDKLREDRITTYNKILEPFVIFLTTDAAWKVDPKNKSRDKNTVAQQALLSLEYRREAFKMSLVGSDGVVASYNDLMQYFYQLGTGGETMGVDRVKDISRLLGRFLLEIRKSMGNEATELDHWQMLEWFMVDARAYRAIPHNPGHQADG
jgi:hypothetical protein